MAEITMCRDATCPRTKDCLRFKSVPSEWQSYAKFNWYVAGVIHPIVNLNLQKITKSMEIK